MSIYVLRRFFSRFGKLFLPILAGFWLSSCAAAGLSGAIAGAVLLSNNSNTTAPAPAPPNDPARFETDEYFGRDIANNCLVVDGKGIEGCKLVGDYSTGQPLENFTLDAIKASHAYAAGATGDNIKIAVIDAFNGTIHQELQGQIYAELDVFNGLYDPDIAPADSKPTWLCQDQDANTWYICTTERPPDGQEPIPHDGFLVRPADDEGGDHGNKVASVIAAKRDEKGFHGVAPGAKLINIRADLPGTCGDPDTGCQFPYDSFIFMLNTAKQYGAHIVNMSLGGDAELSDPVKQSFYDAANLGLLMVGAAGNIPLGIDANNNIVYPTGTNGNLIGASPVWPAAIAGDSQMLGRAIIAGSADSNRRIASYSYRAGDGAARDYYLLVPSSPTFVVAGTDGYSLSEGTSFAAPVVSGSLALLLQTFPELQATPERAISILLDTADDYVSDEIDPVAGTTAGVGTDSVGGRGLLNLENAFKAQPPTSASLNGAAVPLSSVLSAPGGAFGDWANNAFDGIAYFDRYHRGFTLEESSMAVPPDRFGNLVLRLSGTTSGNSSVTRTSLGVMRVTHFTPEPPDTGLISDSIEADSIFRFDLAFNNGRLGFGQGIAAPQGPGPVLGLTESKRVGTRTRWFRMEQDVYKAPNHEFGLLAFAESSDSHSLAGFGLAGSGHSWQMQGSAQTRIDNDNALGGAVQSRFGNQDISQTLSVLLEGRLALPLGWELASRFEGGTASLSGLDTGTIWLSSWAVQASHHLIGGTASIAVSQPMRAETGSLSFDTSLRPQTGAQIEPVTRYATLAPSGRETNLELRWTRPLPFSGWAVSAGTAIILQAWHVANAPPSSALWMSLNGNW